MKERLEIRIEIVDGVSYEYVCSSEDFKDKE